MKREEIFPADKISFQTLCITLEFNANLGSKAFIVGSGKKGGYRKHTVTQLRI